MEFKEKSNLLNLKKLTSPNNHIKSKVMNPKVLFLILFPLFVFSQSPQKINFQSILRNTNGEIVANKSVSLKISILSGSINGSSVYAETNTKTTDASGLISLQIGNGTVLSGVFANIGWGNASHFIKLEADFNGGSNFVVLGTQELMSVPYALYASKATNPSGIEGIYSWEFPEGLSKEIVFISSSNLPYTVPSGKNLYITTGSQFLTINGFIFGAQNSGCVLSQGTRIDDFPLDSPTGTEPGITGFLVEKSDRIQPVLVIFNNSQIYTVPSGKILVIRSNGGGNGRLCINNITNIQNPDGYMLLPEGTIIKNCSSSDFNYLGYLIDK